MLKILASPEAIIRFQANIEAIVFHINKKFKKKPIDDATVLTEKGLDKISEAILNLAREFVKFSHLPNS